ncbi:hypothetical protein N7539_002601 [Penicillium diatomitis]|uniref:Phosphoglycerate mutase family protein n=1 Tax=Penicillium diatomitis TaxID=2819901 RepID=A0A9W9XEY8_9EURO|nr:uncharacterized protein N7539_002601 [Penicillium diatomitis]KAJ5491034.1 hypothetical protein N7539_002601 [Penicillium diatomitis]
MRIYLIRHGETVHNVAQVWAGSTDSALTNHGMLQIESLGRFFANRPIQFDHVYSSDLSRARITAEGICRMQPSMVNGAPLTPILSPDLRERDFGSLEGVRIQRATGTPVENFSQIVTDREKVPIGKEKESKESMRKRSLNFLQTHLLPLLLEEEEHYERRVAIVAHGLILRALWFCLTGFFDPSSISVMPGTAAWNGGPPALLSPVWSNTGVMEILISMRPICSSPAPQYPDMDHGPDEALYQAETAQPDSKVLPLLQGWSMKIVGADNTEHLAGLRRTRGGIGSASYDSRQKRIDSFFK